MVARIWFAAFWLSVAFWLGAVLISPALAGPPQSYPAAAHVPDSTVGGVVLAQSFKETPLNDLPAVDRERAQPSRTTSQPPPPPPVPRAPRVTTRTTPPPADDDTGPPVRDTPPPRGTGTPARTFEPPPPPPRRAEPRYEEPPPPTRRAERARPQQPPARSSFYANCTEQCHLACEAAFEGCNGDSSPAKPECVRKLEACRVERCSCRFE